MLVVGGLHHLEIDSQNMVVGIFMFFRLSVRMLALHSESNIVGPKSSLSHI